MAILRYVTLTGEDSNGTPINYSGVACGNQAQTAVVTRDIDGAIMVPYAGFDQALLTNPSVGKYLVNITSYNLDPTYDYKFWFTISIENSSPIEVYERIRAASQEKTLRGYSRAIAATGLIGRYALHQVSATSTDLREFQCNSLIDKEDPNDVVTPRHGGAMAYFASGLNLGEQRRVMNTDGYIPTQGICKVHRDYPNLPTVGDLVELWYRIPRVVDESTGGQGIREIINRALSVCYRVRRLSFTATEDNQRVFDLGDYPWLTRKEQVGQIFDAPEDDTTDPFVVHPGGCWLRYDGASPKLEVAVPFNDDDVFYVDVAQPAHTYIKSDGVWGDSTVGLVNDDDEALVDQTLLVQVALGYAFEYLSGIVTDSERATWLSMADTQKKRAAALQGVFGSELDPSSRNTWNAATTKGQGPSTLGGGGSILGRAGRGRYVGGRRWR
jgi:hypothetical protein